MKEAGLGACLRQLLCTVLKMAGRKTTPYTGRENGRLKYTLQHRNKAIIVTREKEKLFAIAFVCFITDVFIFLENAKQHIICQDF